MRVKLRTNINRIGDEKGPPIGNDASVLNTTTIRQLLRPSLISMAVCGCYNFEVRCLTSRKGRLFQIFGRLYRILIFIICFGSVIKTLASFSNLSSFFMQMNMIRTGWYTQCLVVFLISLKSNLANKGGQRKAFNFWDEKIRQEMQEIGLEFPGEKIKKRQKVYLIIAVAVSFVGFLGNILLTIDPFNGGFNIFYSAPFDNAITFVVWENVIFVVNTLIWIFPIFYIITVSTFLTSTFEVFNTFLEKHIEQNCSVMTGQFQKIRKLHLDLCRVVSHFDQDFGCYLAAMMILSVGTSCFILYVILKSQADILELVLFVFWLCTLLSLLGAMSIFAAVVNEAVSRTWHTLLIILPSVLISYKLSTRPRSAVGNVSGYRCVSDCRSSGR